MFCPFCGERLDKEKEEPAKVDDLNDFYGNNRIYSNTRPVPVKTEGPFGKMGLIFGILGLVTDIILIGLDLCVLGLIFSCIGLKRINNGKAKAGLALSIVGLILGFIWIVVLEVILTQNGHSLTEYIL